MNILKKLGISRDNEQQLINKPTVVVVGAGFGGIEAIKQLSKMEVNVILIDKNNYHQFTPLLYQVASAEVDPSEVIFPIRQLIRDKENVKFIRDELISIDREIKVIVTKNKVIHYDFLVLGLGSRTSYHKVPGAVDHAFAMKTIPQAIELKNQILKCFEAAELEDDPVIRRNLLTFVIAGGGPAGVEYAGALSELIYGPLIKDHPNISKDEINIHIVDSGETVLGRYDPKLSKYATEKLIGKGVIFEQQAYVSKVSEKFVVLSNGKEIRTRTVIWNAGTQGHRIVKDWGFEVTRNNLIKTKSTLQSTVDKSIFIVGDMAYIIENPLPALTTVAIQQGDHVANNIELMIKGEQLQEFKYKDRGTMAVIGRSAAVFQTNRLKLTGFFAWSIWAVFHLFKLGGVRNRLNIMINWIWSYLFSDNSVRVIIPEVNNTELLVPSIYNIDSVH